MDLRRTLISRLALAFIGLLLLFAVVWLQDLRDDAVAEQKATSRLVAFLLAQRNHNASDLLATALPPGQFRHVKLQWAADGAGAPQTATSSFMRWLGLGPDVAMAHRIQVNGQTVWIQPDPESEFREKLTASVQLLLMLLLFCAVCLSLTWTAVHHALSPVKDLNAGLVRLAEGEDKARLPRFELREFAAIAHVVDQLAVSLTQARERQSRLTRQLMEVQDKERRELAAELHDELGQSLTAITATAAYIEHHAHHATAQVLTECAHEIGCESRRIAGHVRQMLTSLRPYGLEHSGLSEALRELVLGWQVRLPDRQIECDIEALPAVSADAALALYRCLQEALTNCVRHSGATQIQVRCEMRNAGIQLCVADNGKGQSAELRHLSGSGLLGLRERLTMVGGQMNITDRDGGGIVLRVWLPVQHQETA